MSKYYDIIPTWLEELRMSCPYSLQRSLDPHQNKRVPGFEIKHGLMVRIHFWGVSIHRLYI